MNILTNDEANELARDLRNAGVHTEHPDFERLCAYAYHWACVIAKKYRHYLPVKRMDIEDLAQDVVCRVVRYWARFDPCRGRFSTWLKTVSTNEILRVRAHEARHRRLWEPFGGEAA